VVIDGGVLAGTGTITTGLLGLDLNAAGAIAPGPVTPGGIGALVFNATGAEVNIADVGAGGLRYDLSSPAFSDKITVTGGALNIGAGVLGFDNFAFNELALFNAGDIFILFDTPSPILGTVAADFTGPLGGGLFGQLRVSLDGTDLELTVVPEPAGATLIMAAITGLAGLRRRPNRKVVS
jgi:hypothetical protein